MPDVSATLHLLSWGKTLAGVEGQGTSAGVGAETTPATADFWIAAEGVPLATGGGWGSFTAAVLKFRDGWGKSFGTIGYESTTANADYAKTAAVYN